MLELADTGTGMTPKTLARVFYPFFTTKEVGKGTGLGLSMVPGFVEQSGGYVDIESEIVRGTAVRIFLSRAEARNVTKTGSQVSLTINKDIKATVLVVEDDENVRELVILMLSDLGCAVIEAEDGNLALELLDRAPGVDLLFTDVVLPGGLNGVEIAGKVRDRCPEVKIVFTSGYPDGEIENLTSNRIPAQFLRKPYPNPTSPGPSAKPWKPDFTRRINQYRFLSGMRSPPSGTPPVPRVAACDRPPE